MEASSSNPVAGSPRFIDDGYLELCQVVGTGAYGVVWLAVDHRYGSPIYRAVKALRRFGLDARQRHFQRRELSLHNLASNHDSIINMDRIVEEDDHIYVVMDFGEDGDLFGMICDRQRYVGDDELIRSVFLQLLDGVAHIHSLGIAHRDIKPENIVCSDDGLRVRICDFGLATSEIQSSEFGCGSTFYIAPECLGDWFPDNKSYPTKAGDIWSLGVILVNLVCGRNPWRIASPTDESFNAFHKDPMFLRKILPISTQCLEILRTIFTIDPHQRTNLADLRQKILHIRSFSMSEEEALVAHAAAKAQAQVQAQAQAKKVVKEEMIEEEIMEEDEDYTINLADEEDLDWVDEEVPFDLEDLNESEVSDRPPSLRPDSGSPSPPAHRSRSSSSMGISLPPTPLLGAEEGAAISSLDNSKAVWDLFNQQRPSSSQKKHHHINLPTSPQVITPGQQDCYF